MAILLHTDACMYRVTLIIKNNSLWNFEISNYRKNNDSRFAMVYMYTCTYELVVMVSVYSWLSQQQSKHVKYLLTKQF